MRNPTRLAFRRDALATLQPLLLTAIAALSITAACTDSDDESDCGGCAIGGVCYPHGVTNPANPCQECDSAGQTSDWSPRDGAACHDGVFCNRDDACMGGACTSHAGSPCEAVALMCHEAGRQCLASCDGCLIGGTCFFEGARNPSNDCQVCDTSVATSSFANDDGASCDDGLQCNGADSCEAGICAHGGSPCDASEVCWEGATAQCCSEDITRGCDLEDRVVEQDSCGHVSTVLMDCGASGSVCSEGRCLCDPVAGTGCPPDLKCTSTLVRTECVPDGTLPFGAPCTPPDVGADDCAAGLFCYENSCRELCGAEPDTCPSGYRCDTGGVSAAFPDQIDVGVCDVLCDPVVQDCAKPTDACYLGLPEAVVRCLSVPPTSVGLTQGSQCAPSASGNCSLDGCDKGYGGLLPNGSCGFFCSPIDNWNGNAIGLAGDPVGITCDAQFGGARPDGPGPGFECRFIQSFYSDTAEVAPMIGFCVEPAAEGGGSCADFDLNQFVADFKSGVATDPSYCDAHPQNCMFSCVSRETLESALQ